MARSAAVPRPSKGVWFASLRLLCCVLPVTGLVVLCCWILVNYFYSASIEIRHCPKPPCRSLFPSYPTFLLSFFYFNHSGALARFPLCSVFNCPSTLKTSNPTFEFVCVFQPVPAVQRALLLPGSHFRRYLPATITRLDLPHYRLTFSFSMSSGHL